MAKPGQPSSNSSDGDRDIARVRTELSNRLESRGVEVFDSDSPLDVVEIMEEQDKSDLRLSDEQAVEVRRRLANPSEKTIPAEEVFKRFRSPRT